MLAMGVDVSKRTHEIEIQNHAGKVMWNGNVRKNRKAFEELDRKMKSVMKSNNDTIAGIYLEPTSNYHICLLEFLKSKGYRVVRVSPSMAKAARKVLNNGRDKSDPIDAHALASLHWMLPSLSEKKNHQRDDLTELTRFNEFVTNQHVSSFKNYLCQDIARIFPEYLEFMNDFCIPTSLAILEKYPVPSLLASAPISEISDLVKKASKGHKKMDFVSKLQELARETVGIPDESGLISFRIRKTIKMLRFMESMQEEIEEELVVHVSENDCVRWMDDIPGITTMEASAIVAEIGPIEQFQSASKVIGFAANVPRQSQSGDKNWTGRPAKDGNHYLRRASTMAAFSAIKHCPEFKAIYEKALKNKKTPSQALIIVGNRILWHAYSILKNKKPYRERMPQVETTPTP